MQNELIKIAFPEFDKSETLLNSVKKAQHIYNFVPVKCENVEEACLLLNKKEINAIIAGKTCISKEVIKTCYKLLGINNKNNNETFSGNIVTGKKQIIADAACCVQPSAKQLKDIIIQAHDLFVSLFDYEPNISVLSYSTLGSGGNNQKLNDLRKVVQEIKKTHENYLINGELQLDVALNENIAKEKGEKLIKGKSDILICPDLNSGNILYKAYEAYNDDFVAGPILTGFNGIVSDLSRGSNEKDIIYTIELIIKMINKESKNV